jgi:hypothetical protein
MARTRVIETDEFHEAVAAKAAEVAEAVIARRLQELVAASVPAGAVSAPASGGAVDVLGEILSKLSSNLQAVATQGQRNKPLSPEEIIRRELAEQRMLRLIKEAHEANDPERKPSYKLIAKICFNERLVEPYKVVDKRAVNNEITWTGAPNDAMQPINDAARAIFAAWRESTGGPLELVPTADRRPLYVTPAGLTVRGDPPKRQYVAADPNFKDDLGFDNGDPNAPEIAVLGTVAAKARQNSVTGVGLAAVAVT